jgi:uncharacterized protein
MGRFGSPVFPFPLAPPPWIRLPARGIPFTCAPKCRNMPSMKHRQKPGPRIDERFAFFRLRLDRSRIHRFGVFAEETIPPSRKVIEYTGERISRRESRRRFLKACERPGQPLLYLFRLNDHWVIDGAVGGSGAQFINHSCDPNLFAATVDGCIMYKSRRRIIAGEELTVDYQYPRKGEIIRCRCRATNCRGTLNVRA